MKRILILCLVLAGCTKAGDPVAATVPARNVDKTQQIDTSFIQRTSPDEFGVVCYSVENESVLSCVKVTQ